MNNRLLPELLQKCKDICVLFSANQIHPITKKASLLSLAKTIDKIEGGKDWQNLIASPVIKFCARCGGLMEMGKNNKPFCGCGCTKSYN